MLKALRFRSVWLVAAAPVFALIAGCGDSHAKFQPKGGEGRAALEAALTAWRDGKPLGPIEATPPVRVADSAWEKGQELDSFRIGSEEISGEGTKEFAVTLKMKKSPTEQDVRYVVLGRDPVWVFRYDDYKRTLNMENDPVTTPHFETRFSAIRQAPMSNASRDPSRRVELTPRLSGPVWRKVRSALKLIQVRLRIPIVLVFAALVVGRWDVIRNYWDKLTRLAPSESIASHPVSADTEYFCPMDPGVVSVWPGRCGVCNMALVRRKKGEAVALPDGVVARMQLSPYRIQLAGIQTLPAGFLPLKREFESSGVVSRAASGATVLLELPARQAPWVAKDQAAEVSCVDLGGRDPFIGHVRSVERATDGGWEHLRATIVIDDPPKELRDGMMVVVRIKVPVAALEPFRSFPSDPPPLAKGELHQVYACPDHADTLASEPGHCPIDRNVRVARPLADHQRLRWWCPMHPTVTADHSGALL